MLLAACFLCLYWSYIRCLCCVPNTPPYHPPPPTPKASHTHTQRAPSPLPTSHTKALITPSRKLIGLSLFVLSSQFRIHKSYLTILLTPPPPVGCLLTCSLFASFRPPPLPQAPSPP
ncbi:hypothetical protein L211DRAFT_866699, partial [Terfezia boudieri ATCC MYA-4762]